MTEKSETPRTDVVIARWPREHFGAMSDHARTLEREISRLQSSLTEAERRIGELETVLMDIGYGRAHDPHYAAAQAFGGYAAMDAARLLAAKGE